MKKLSRIIAVVLVTIINLITIPHKSLLAYSDKSTQAYNSFKEIQFESNSKKTINIPANTSNIFVKLKEKSFINNKNNIQFSLSKDKKSFSKKNYLSIENHLEGMEEIGIIFEPIEIKNNERYIKIFNNSPNSFTLFIFYQPDYERMQINEIESTSNNFIYLNGVPILSRSGWGCPDNDPNSPYYCNGPFWPLSYYPTTHIIIHHTATSNTSNDWAATVRAIWYNHSHVRDADPNDGVQGWTDIGYNYLIDPNGVIYEGRYGGERVTAGHVTSHNKGTIGIGMLGDFTNQSITQKAKNSLISLLSGITSKNQIDPHVNQTDASGYYQPVISGHRDWASTACPGNTFYPEISSIRNQVEFIPANKNPVYRFWSDKFQSHFYTANNTEKYEVLMNYPDVWNYESVGFYSPKDKINTVPVYRFWSDSKQSHFYTTSTIEKNQILQKWSNIWVYEGKVFLAKSKTKNGCPDGFYPIYRFWSDKNQAHFFTKNKVEKNQVLQKWPNIWKYEGEAFCLL